MMRLAFAKRSVMRSFVFISLIILFFAILSSILCSITYEEPYNFHGRVIVTDTYVTNLVLLLDRTGLDSAKLYNLKFMNITFKNICKETEVILHLFYENEKLKLLNVYNLTEYSQQSFILQPPYSSYIFFFNVKNTTTIDIHVLGIYVYYPYKFLAFVSLVLFVVGTYMLIYSCVLVSRSYSGIVRVSEKSDA